MSRSDAEHLEDVRDHLAMLRTHLERSDLDDGTVFDAVCMRLSAAIESLSNIDESSRSTRVAVITGCGGTGRR